MTRWNVNNAAVCQRLLSRNAGSSTRIRVNVRNLARVSSFVRQARLGFYPLDHAVTVYGCAEIYLRIYDLVFSSQLTSATAPDRWLADI